MNQLFKKISVTVAAVAAVSALSVSTFAVEGTVTPSGSLRLRAESNTSSEILASLPASSVVEVSAITENGWFQVNYSGKTGFVSGDFLTVGASEVATLPVLKDPIYGVVSEGPLNVRSGASTDNSVVKILNVGTVLTIVDDSADGWYETEDGFVSSNYVEVVSAEKASELRAVVTATASSSSSSGSAVVNFAKSLLGCRYVYGGTTTSGFDCSGFVQYVYKNFGVTLNRSSRDQYSNGVAVSKSNLQAGDLVFFAKNGSTITHVGLYIGNNQFIHASSPTTGVIISDLYGASYNTTYVGARRVI